MNKTYNLIISSQKGGVGKTTVAVNLAVALRMQGYRTLLTDMDFYNPSVGFQMGLADANIGIRAVMSGKASLESAVTIHGPTGLHVLPGEITGKDPDQSSFRNISYVYRKITSSNYDFNIIDTYPGPVSTGILKYLNIDSNTEALILLTPEMSACVSAVRLAHIYERSRIAKIFVANRLRYKRYELSLKEIEEVCKDNLFAALPEDESVPISVASHIPAYLRRRSKFSRAIHDMSIKYVTRTGIGSKEAVSQGFFSFISRLFRRGG